MGASAGMHSTRPLGQGWEAMFYHKQNFNQAVRTRKPGDNQKAKALWAVKTAGDGEEHL